MAIQIPIRFARAFTPSLVRGVAQQLTGFPRDNEVAEALLTLAEQERERLHLVLNRPDETLYPGAQTLRDVETERFKRAAEAARTAEAAWLDAENMDIRTIRYAPDDQRQVFWVWKGNAAHPLFRRFPGAYVFLGTGLPAFRTPNAWVKPLTP